MGPRPRIRPRLARRGGGSLLSQSEPASGQEGRLEPARSEEGGPLAPGAADSASATPLLASALAAQGAPVVSAEVALGPVGGSEAPEPVVVGSLTVDGMTYALSEDGATLVAVAPGSFGVDGPDGGRGEVGTSEPSAPSGPSEIPSIVSCGDVSCDVVAIGAFAFYLSGATEVSIPASIASVDERAFRSSDVERVEADPASPYFASFDGCLYDSQLKSLLLIPEGRAGAVLLPREAEVVEASEFSHCSLVDSISVEEGGAAFASWEGLLYDASGATLLRVPAGATDITVREGCTTIAAGAMEGCAKLESIEAPSTVTSISPDVFSQAPPTVSLPVASVIPGEFNKGDGDQEDAGDILGSAANGQLSATVALTATEASLPKIDASRIVVRISGESDPALWEQAGMSVDVDVMQPYASTLDAMSYSVDANNPYVQAIYTWVNCSFGENTYVNNVPAGTVTHTASAGSFVNGEVACYETLVFGAGTDQYTSAHVLTADGRTTYAFDYFNYASTERGKYCQQSLYRNAERTVQYGAGVYQSTFLAYLGWGYTNYTVTFNSNGGTACSSLSGNITQNIVLPTPTREGYTFRGWKVGSSTYGAGTISINTLSASAGCAAQKTTDTIGLTAQWEANSYTVEYRNRENTATLSSDTGFKYDATRNLAVKPASGLTNGYNAVGWATSPNQSVATYSFGSSQKNLATSGTVRLYLAEAPNAYTVILNPNGGTTPTGHGTASVTYDNGYSWAIPEKIPTRQGYAFAGWADASGTAIWDAIGASIEGPYWSADRKWQHAGNVTAYAQWTPVIAVDVPASVTARIDLLGIEDQEEASGYIRSLCGEPLRVEAIECASKPGASVLFGSWVDQVRLEVSPGAAGGGSVMLDLGADGFVYSSTAPASLASFLVGSYGDELPVAYRFAIPSGFPLVSLAEGETEACRVSYTVALA